MTISHSDKPFKAPKTDDQRDKELAMERLNEKIRDGISEVIVQANTDIAALKSELDGDITTLTTSVTTNTTNIATNTTNIATNTSSIGTINTTLLKKIEEVATTATAVLPEGAQSGHETHSTKSRVVYNGETTDNAEKETQAGRRGRKGSDD